MDFHVVCQSGNSRVGILRDDSPSKQKKQASTPAPLLLSLRGSLPNLPGQMMPSCYDGQVAESPLIQVPLLDFALINGFSKYTGLDLMMAVQPDGVHGNQVSFHDIGDCTRNAILFLSLKAAGSDDFADGGVGSSKPDIICGDSRGGANRVKISPQEALALQQALKCDIMEAPSEQALAFAPQKIVERSVTKSLRMLDDLSQMVATAQSHDSSLPILAAVQGCASMDMRIRHAKMLSERADKLFGYVISGLYCGESFEQRQNIISTVVPLLPTSGLRVMNSTGNPLEILDGVMHGVDVFESSYPFEMAANSLALNLSQMGPKLNLRDKAYKLDKSPLQPGCTCEACNGAGMNGVQSDLIDEEHRSKFFGYYSRSYIHHLLNVHEMLATTLLCVHNLHDYYRFFGDIRTSIRNDQFMMFRERFYTQMRERLNK